MKGETERGHKIYIKILITAMPPRYCLCFLLCLIFSNNQILSIIFIFLCIYNDVSMIYCCIYLLLTVTFDDGCPYVNQMLLLYYKAAEIFCLEGKETIRGKLQQTKTYLKEL